MNWSKVIVTAFGLFTLPWLFMAIECWVWKKRLFTRHRLVRSLRHAALAIPVTILGMLVPNTQVYHSLLRHGLLTLLHIKGAPAVVLGLLIIELNDYLEHRAEHVVPFLWRFHRVHHSDPEMDATTNNRVHFFDIPRDFVLYALAGLCGVPPLAAQIWVAASALYEYLQHSDIPFPEPIERFLGWFFVTPMVHRIHHSRRMDQTNSNYGHTITIWDRLFGTWLAGPRVEQTGLDEYVDDRWSTVRGMLVTPFVTTPAPRLASANPVRDRAASIEQSEPVLQRTGS